jgi:outer membrane protein TolC
MREDADESGGAQPTASGQAGLSQRMPLGGTASVNLGTTYDRSTFINDINDQDDLREFIESREAEESTVTTDNFRPEASATIRQPLLKGAGRLIERESLTQAERELVYALRAYALFQQDLTIQTATTYWQLLQQRRSIETAERNLQNNQYSFEQSQAFLDIGKTTLDQVLRARIELVRAQQGVVDAQRSFEASLDQFKLDLFLPIETPIALADEQLDFEPVEVDLGRAIEDGLILRLELMTSEDRIEDAERALKIAKNGMMAQLDLVGNGRWRGDTTDRFGDQSLDRFNYDASIQLTIPLERSQERQTLEQALIGLSRAQRDYRNERDSIILGIRRTVRNLRQAEASIQLQGINQREAARRLEKARLDYEEGEASNLSIIEAQNALVEAENSYYRAVVDYQIAKLQLLRETGRLELDENGMWIE